MHSNREWLETNEIGGFASGSVSGAPSRRYHGLLCASLNPPTDRHLLVSHLIENVITEGRAFPLSCEHYLHHRPDPVVTSEFQPYPYAHWQFQLPMGSIEKSVTMVAHENTTLVRYKNNTNQRVTLQLKPLLAARDYHALRQDGPAPNVRIEGNMVTVKPEGQPSIYISSSQANWHPREDYYHELYYHTEADRGFEAVEANFLAAALEAPLAPGEVLLLRFSTAPGLVSEEPFKRKAQSYEHAGAETERFRQDIALAAQAFVVHRESSNSPTVLAGYPWFTDWGRDTLIALRDFQDFMAPGEAQQIIKTFLHYSRNGLIPNRFPDDPEDEVEYNTLDASLWLFVAVWELQQQNPDPVFLEQIIEPLTHIIEAHIKGTDFKINVLETGLLSGGEAPWQLTWMDAKIGEYTVTPRRGCAVEINLLWYNALKIYQAGLKQTGRKGIQVQPWIEKFEAVFVETFWNVEAECLYDFIDENQEPKKQIRPNQIYALSLPFTPLTSDAQKRVLQQVGKNLYTPLGLRTLSPGDPDFRASYVGDTWSRDTAYHQGTVWPFLLREYWRAYQKVHGGRKTRKLLRTEIEILKKHFYSDAGIGSVSEVFDGLEPLHGKGCPQQAWSVAALWHLIKLLD